MLDRQSDLSIVTFLNSQPIKFVINGLVATCIHFFVLTFNLKVLNWASAGLANLVAALFGILASFLGSRYFVFQGSVEPLVKQVSRFVFLYAALALMHGGFMHVWVDVYFYNYVVGFVLATGIQVVCSYIGNKVMVFKV